METNIPVVENANVWGLIGLKKGDRRSQQKVVNQLRKSAETIETVNELAKDQRSRRVAYKGVKRQMTLWKGPVYQNRLAEQLIFPLNDNSITVSNSEAAEKMKEESHIAAAKEAKDSISSKLYNALYKNPPLLHKQSNEGTVDREVRRKLLQTIAAREKERFLLARMAGRNKRQNKIKSKAYTRHRKSRLTKEFEKEMEEMRQNNPKMFAKRILQADLLRAKERTSLRHRGGSKFARMQKLRAKYDSEARNAVAEMHEKSKELTKKTTADSSESEDSDIDITSESEEDTEDSDFDLQKSASDADTDPGLSSLLWWRQSTEDPEEKPQVQKGTQPSVLSTLAVEAVLDHTVAPVTLRYSDNAGAGDEPEADILDPGSDGFYRALQETCATDSALKNQFTEDKANIIDTETPKDIDTFLPGWNAWTGPGLETKDEKRRKKRMIPAPRVKRSDTGKSHVIIKHRVNNEFREHLVKTIPFPYNTPEQFEAYIAQPISREWVTESAHHEFTRPKVTVQTGRVIRPISRSAALLRDKDVERLNKQKKDV